VAALIRDGDAVLGPDSPVSLLITAGQRADCPQFSRVLDGQVTGPYLHRRPTKQGAGRPAGPVGASVPV